MNEREIFMAALDRESPDERNRYLDKACGDDQELRRRVDALLKSYAASGSFLERPVLADEKMLGLNRATDPAGPQPPADGQPDPAEAGSDPISLDFLQPSDAPDSLGRLGQYEVREVVGRGGMGVVLKAHDTKLHRIVAVKVLAPELASNAAARKRFVREAQAVAAVSHHHVVTIYAVEEDPLPYLAMEFIDGVSLEEKIDRQGQLSLREILRIGQQIAAGLAAAHAHGIIHRDIKPANILLQNGIERVQITDFGLARAVDDVAITRSGEVAGTPQFMSPEQAQGQPVDARSDLFSLGAVLYTMCTGWPPFRADTTVAILRRICDDTARPIREVNPDVPDWLVEIVDRLLAKQPEDRFETAAEVAELLGRHLAHVQDPGSTPFPGRLSAAERRRVGRARRRRFWLAAAIILLTVVGSLGLTEATGVTQLTASVIRVVTGEGTLVIKVDDPGVSVTIDGEDLVITGAGPQEVRLKPGQYRVRAAKGGQLLKQELVTIQRGGRLVVSISYEPKTPPPGQEAGWVSLFNGRDLTGWKTHPDRPGGWTVKDGVLTGRTDPPAYLFSERGDFENFHLRVEARVNFVGVHGIFFRSEFGLSVEGGDYPAGYKCALGPEAATVILKKNNQLRARGDPIPIRPDTWFLEEVIARGNHIVVKVNDQVTVDYVDPREPYSKGHLVLWAWRAGCIVQFRSIEIKELPPGDFGEAVTAPLPPSDVGAGAPAPWPPSDYEVRRYVGHTAGVDSVCVSPDGRRILSASDDGTVRLWDLETGAELRCFRGHSQFVHALAFLPDGNRLVSGSGDGTVRIWDAETGEELHRLTGHLDSVERVAVLPDGKRVASASLDKTVRVWDVESGQQVGMLELDQPMCSVAALPDGRHVLCGDGAGALQLWDLDEASLVRRMEGHTDKVKGIAISPDGRHALSAGAEDGTVRLWDLQTGEELRTFEGRGWAHSVAFAPGGQLALTGWSADMLLWDLETGRKLGTFRAPSGVKGAAFVPGKLQVVSAHWSHTHQDDVLRLWELPESLWPDAAVLDRLAQVSKSIEAEPDDMRLVHQRGRLYARLGRYDEAARDFIRANELLASPWGWSHSSGVFDSLMQHEEVFARIAELRPNDLALWAERGQYYARRGQWERAVPGYARASDLRKYELYHASALLLTGDEDGYRRLCRRMTAQFGQTDEPSVALQLALVCSEGARSGIDPAQIAKWAQLSLGSGRNGSTLQALALASYRAGQFDQAVALLQEAMHLPDAIPKRRAAFPLALAYRALGQEEEGRKWYQVGIAAIEGVIPRDSSSPVPWLPGHWSGVNVWYREAKAVFEPTKPQASKAEEPK